MRNIKTAKRLEISSFIIAFVGLVVFVLIIRWYFLQGYWIGFRAGPEITSSFGTLVAGTVGPIWALAGVLFFYSALKLQQQEIKDQKDMFYTQNTETTVIKMIDQFIVVYNSVDKEFIKRGYRVITQILNNSPTSLQDRLKEKNGIENHKIMLKDHFDKINTDDRFNDLQKIYLSIIFYIGKSNLSQYRKNALFDYFIQIGGYELLNIVSLLEVSDVDLLSTINKELMKTELCIYDNIFPGLEIFLTQYKKNQKANSSQNQPVKS